MKSATWLSLLVGWLVRAYAADPTVLSLETLEPTPLFPRPPAGGPLRQQARLHLQNAGAPFAATARITVGDEAAYTEALAEVPAGKSTNAITITDISASSQVLMEVIRNADQQVMARKAFAWQPPKKWKVFCISYSHHDLGFGNYPHRLRTEIRHANIERPLKFCAETDGWDDDSKFRYVIETAEPITSFLGSHPEADAAELARRIREGRIQVGALHNTANTEQLSGELLARLFYLSGRHTPDLLGVPRGRTALLDDVIGVTWPLATALKEAGVSYFFHGYNGCGHCLQPAESEPVFWWQGPDQDSRTKVLTRSVPYGGYAGDSLGDASPARLQQAIQVLGAHWPYDSLLLQDGTDFQLVTRDNADRIRHWNAQYAFPRLICATLDMFFDDLARQADPAQIKTFAKDANNQWADQDATDAWLLGWARRQGEAIPTAEKFATIATTLAGGGYPWTDLYQAYHRLLAYHEHTDAIDSLGPDRERMQQYETELEENREMVLEARDFGDRARENAFDKLTRLITTQADQSLVVFNPLARSRTDVVRWVPAPGQEQVRLKDETTGQEVPIQKLPGGDLVFIGTNIPALGYKTYSVFTSDKLAGDTASVVTALENRFYRLEFNPVTGAISSLRDKQSGLELVDQAAPHQFNEYLYERFERPSLSETSKWYRVQQARLSVSRGPVASVMRVEAAPMGVDSLQQTVILYHDLRRIDFELDLVKSPSGRTCRQSNSDARNKESAFVALPLMVPDFRFHHELPGGVVEPIRDQFEGSCTAYYAARHFADVSNRRFGVTVSSPEIALVEYGYPRSCPITGGREHEFERVMQYPSTSRMYLYLLDNMFDVNIRWDQRGPMRFTWSLRSHEGDWQTGQADQFGWDVLNPLLPRAVSGQQSGPLPAAFSFVSVDAPNVACTVLKPAEANGAGFILRFHETQGKETSATVSLPFVGRITAATETDLVENDRPAPVAIREGQQLRFTIRPFGVKTLRVLNQPATSPPAVTGFQATPLSDMQVRLTWSLPADRESNLSHFHLYRGLTPGFQPLLLNRVARPATAPWTDQPLLNYGGWIHNRLEPGTIYYYRVAVVDRWNNEGPCSPVVSATTLKPGEKNMVPLRVEGLRAILVSPLVSHLNYVNLLFRSSCESDVRRYEIHRSRETGFTPGPGTRLGMADAEAVVKGSTAYGHVPRDYRQGDYDHLMFQDETVQPLTTYYYRVCAVDAAGQRGPFSPEASVRTKGLPSPTTRATASSVYAPEYGPENAVDGSPSPYAAWISRPYGGGTKEQPSDAWLTVEFPKPLNLQGVVISGDERPEIPLQTGLRLEYREEGQWKTAAEVRQATGKILRTAWTAPIATDALRVYIPAPDLPKSTRADIPDGVVRICELLLILPDGRELSPAELWP